MVRFVLALLLLGCATGTFVQASDEYFEGDGTSYVLDRVSSGNCNFMSALPTASSNYVALNDPQSANLGNCGRCIEVSCIDAQCTVKNKTAIVQVVDRCPECGTGALDLPPGLYKEITGFGPNRLRVRWRFVACPNAGTVHVCLKTGSNPQWAAIQPTNSVVGVQSVHVNGVSLTILNGAYYYVADHVITDLKAVTIAITSMSGDVISGTYSLTDGQCTDTRHQFPTGVSVQETLVDPLSSPLPSAPSASDGTLKPTTTTPVPTAPIATPGPKTAPAPSLGGQNAPLPAAPSSQADIASKPPTVLPEPSVNVNATRMASTSTTETVPTRTTPASKCRVKRCRRPN
ncbi:hypothetical protein PsorP6_009785 [Peronosclerospora sorghi]|uniref:Uncharacterized protein n=1 Tax=Peronosclerospora sorghi TaxID=230839 RepID=A0ACC0W084_9STRA|nr:hypothetical protein PsorP6_009785 [Peronosclerospora sorghi]